MTSRYDLTEFEWRVIDSLLPNKPRGVTRVDDREVSNANACCGQARVSKHALDIWANLAFAPDFGLTR